MWRHSESTTDAAAGLAGLLGSLPEGASPYTFIRKTLNDPIWSPQTGWFYVQTWLFIIINAAIALLSLLGCWKRYRRGTLWWFRLENGYISPNTSALSQTCFALYSLLYIVALGMETLHRPSTNVPAVPYLAYIWLGLAIHFQTWATVYARPRSSLAFSPSSNKHVLDSSSPFRRRLGPRTLNSILVFIAVSFVTGICVGSAFQMRTRMRLMRVLDTINAALDSAEKSGAPLTSLLSLLPVFTEFMDAGNAVKAAGDRSCQVWACWGIIWVSAYPPAALSLIRTLHKQQQHLTRSLDNLHEVDQLSSRPPDMYRPRASHASSASTSVFEPEKKPAETVGDVIPLQVELPTTAFRSDQARTTVQRDEVTRRLKGVRKVKFILMVQFGTTLLMLIEYCAVVIFYFSPGFDRLDAKTINQVMETWLGWAFIIPGTFSALVFFWASFFATRPAPPPSSSLRLNNHPRTELDPDFHPATPRNSLPSAASPTAPPTPPSSTGSSQDRWRKFSTHNSATASTRGGDEESLTPVGSPGGWIPSAWAQQRRSEAILLEVRGGKVAE